MKPNNLILLLTALILLVCGARELPAAEDVKKEVTKILDMQVAAWNNGSIEDFMRGYQISDDVVFTSGGRVIRGWNNMLERYRRTYGTSGLGMLRFSELQIDVISKDAALVVGRWQLQRAAQESGGVFTLLFRKTRTGWRIVHDHTSTSQ